MVLKPQFSLRWMLVAVAPVAFIASEAATFPGWLAFSAGILVTSILPPILVAGAFYACGFSRAFCIGALACLVGLYWMGWGSSCERLMQEIKLVDSKSFPPGILSQPSSPYYDQLGAKYRSGYCALWSLMIVGGFMAVVVRWLTLGRPADAPPRSGGRI